MKIRIPDLLSKQLASINNLNKLRQSQWKEQYGFDNMNSQLLTIHSLDCYINVTMFYLV